MIFKKTKLVLGIATAALTIALVSPQAMAHKVSKKHHHVQSQQSRTQIDILEAQVLSMQDQISRLTAQQNSNMAAAAPIVSGVAIDSAKVEELDQWMASVKAAPVIAKTKDNMIFFRGGYGHANATRGGTLDPTWVPGVSQNRNGVAVGSIADKDAWYFGAGIDFSVNNNLFGLMDNTEVLAEIMWDYKQLGTRGQNGLSGQEVGVVNSLGFQLPVANTQQATVNQFTLAASPKIKFMKGSSFRPWIIPVGFEINVISPPSDAITVLSPGMQFGLGADYKIWKDLYIGADARYHQSLGSIDGVRTNGVTAGGYLGLGF
ncbi:MAG: porin family protein [Methylococcales bacterium]|nr:porin family protein [Methylococcales bacterium]